MWTTLVIVAFFIVIVYNLGAGLFYMMSDKGTTNRTAAQIAIGSYLSRWRSHWSVS